MHILHIYMRMRVCHTSYTYLTHGLIYPKHQVLHIFPPTFEYIYIFKFIPICYEGCGLLFVDINSEIKLGTFLDDNDKRSCKEKKKVRETIDMMLICVWYT